jgi:predicted RecA/RadA family phage recombinase
MTNECIPFYEAAYTQKITVHAGYAITGKTFVGPLTSYQSQGPALATDPLAVGDGGNLIANAAPTAGGLVSGVAAWDAPSGGKVPIIRGGGTILPVTSGAAVAVGNELQVDTQGRVVPFTTGRRVGVAHSAAAGAALDVVVELYGAGQP